MLNFWWVVDSSGITPAGDDVSQEKDIDENVKLHVVSFVNCYICKDCGLMAETVSDLKNNIVCKECKNCGSKNIKNEDSLLWVQPPNKVTNICVNNLNNVIMIDSSEFHYTGTEILRLIENKKFIYDTLSVEFA